MILGMNVVVRMAEPSDVRTLRETRIAALRDTPRAFGSTLQRELGRTNEQWLSWMTKGGHVFFAEHGEGRVAGMVCSAPDFDEADVIRLLAMWVAPGARRQGVGDLLVQAVVATAQQEGARAVALHVVDDNEPACRLYARNGFVDRGVTRVRERDDAVELDLIHILEAQHSS